MRVAIGTAISASVVSVFAASVSLFVAERFIVDAEDARLQSTANQIARELPDGAEGESLLAAVLHEQEELAPASIRISVSRRSTIIGNDANLPSPASGTCISKGIGDRILRACTATANSYQVVAGATHARHPLPWLICALTIASMAAAAAAALLSRHGARWALMPLTRLRESLALVDADNPRNGLLDGDDGSQEVSALRSSLEHLLQRLAEALDSARNFSSDAAHELRTPLTVIQGELDLLDEEPLEAGPKEAVKRLRRRVQALSVLVDRLLTLATVVDRTKLREDAVALEDVVRAAVERLPNTARARVQLRAEDPGMVLGDETLLAVLFDNAIENALKFSGNEPVELELTAASGSITLDVRDYGKGLAEEDRERAFEVFFRTPETRGENIPGHGIGLALVARIATAHHASASFVAPKEGTTGACLRIVFPKWCAAGSSLREIGTLAPNRHPI